MEKSGTKPLLRTFLYRFLTSKFQLIKQKERGHIQVDIDRFTNEQMERMIFDKSYNPFKKDPADGETPALGYDTGDAAFGPSDDEDAEEAARKKAELRARFANA